MSGTDGISSLGKLLGQLQVNEPATAKTGASAGTQVEGSPARLTQDQTSVSVAGGLAAQAAGGSDVRLGKVAELQQAIASGTYNVSAAAVSDKIVEGLLSSR